ncbi:AbrB/MazE/SpoVT family DNA-binding domain-containing protein [Candidatus Pacearchaeota archaeon]|nr:AbrB/MazE/SpoVT family DNA-binding domain-containing protein [Candidatus Pacearchaeota archaeon]
MIRVKLKEWGNSLGVILPKDRLRELGLKKGDSIRIDISLDERLDGFGIAKGAKPFKEEEESHEEFW